MDLGCEDFFKISLQLFVHTAYSSLVECFFGLLKKAPINTSMATQDFLEFMSQATSITCDILRKQAATETITLPKINPRNVIYFS